ncbi:MAG: PHP domain-containing protein [Candidatus Undinarchaeales archaeon]|jgi:hypothetical protein|nr:PHP domain-containing protein [Candidatus Undinarchaeales archaeon]MDP7494416.1 PHP domain-containing protein [Candidatus Undinarchaeales archaeon]
MGDEFTVPFDLHVHSCYSGIRMWKYDGFPTVPEIVAESSRLGLRGIAIADHNSAAGSQQAARVVAEKGIDMLALPAQEARCSRGDVVVLGIAETIEHTDRLSPAELVDRVHDEGGIAIAAHPYAGFWGASVLWAPLSVPFDAVEVYNSHCALIPPINSAAARLARKAGLPGVAGSDAHLLDQLALGVTLFSEDDAGSTDDVLDAVHKGRFALRTRRIGVLSYMNEWVTKLRVNTRYWLMGETIG